MGTCESQAFSDSLWPFAKAARKADAFLLVGLNRGTGQSQVPVIAQAAMLKKITRRYKVHVSK